MSDGAIVKYNGAPWKSDYHYLVDVGFHNGRINMRVFASEPRPLTMNGKGVVSRWVARALVKVIKEQFTKEDYEYTVTDVLPTFD